MRSTLLSLLALLVTSSSALQLVGGAARTQLARPLAPHAARHVVMQESQEPPSEEAAAAPPPAEAPPATEEPAVSCTRHRDRAGDDRSAIALLRATRARSRHL